MVIITYNAKSICPICKNLFTSEEKKHRHIEEKHNNMVGEDQELLEKTADKEILNG